jgi:hypothetical protein
MRALKAVTPVRIRLGAPFLSDAYARSASLENECGEFRWSAWLPRALNCPSAISISDVAQFSVDAMGAESDHGLAFRWALAYVG